MESAETEASTPHLTGFSKGAARRVRRSPVQIGKHRLERPPMSQQKNVSVTAGSILIASMGSVEQRDR